MRGLVPRVIQDDKISREEIERLRVERAERERRERHAQLRGTGGAAAHTRGMTLVASSGDEVGWETVMAAAREGGETRERLDYACLRAVELSRRRRGGTRRGATTAAMSAVAVERMCERARVSAWRRVAQIDASA